jgi:hypothetical protein
VSDECVKCVCKVSVRGPRNVNIIIGYTFIQYSGV